MSNPFLPYSKQAWGFDPRRAGQCVLWLDASDTSTVATTGTTVTQWKDKSGSVTSGTITGAQAQNGGNPTLVQYTMTGYAPGNSRGYIVGANVTVSGISGGTNLNATGTIVGIGSGTFTMLVSGAAGNNSSGGSTAASLNSSMSLTSAQSLDATAGAIVLYTAAGTLPATFLAGAAVSFTVSVSGGTALSTTGTILGVNTTNNTFTVQTAGASGNGTGGTASVGGSTRTLNTADARTVLYTNTNNNCLIAGDSVTIAGVSGGTNLNLSSQTVLPGPTRTTFAILNSTASGSGTGGTALLTGITVHPTITAADARTITYTCPNSFILNQQVTVTGSSPTALNVTGQVLPGVSSSQFSIPNTTVAAATTGSGGTATDARHANPSGTCTYSNTQNGRNVVTLGSNGFFTTTNPLYTNVTTCDFSLFVVAKVTADSSVKHLVSKNGVSTSQFYYMSVDASNLPTFKYRAETATIPTGNTVTGVAVGTGWKVLSGSAYRPNRHIYSSAPIISGLATLGVNGTSTSNSNPLYSNKPSFICSATASGFTYTYTTTIAHGFSVGDIVTTSGGFSQTAYAMTGRVIAPSGGTTFTLTGATSNPGSSAAGYGLVNASNYTVSATSVATAYTYTSTAPHGFSIGNTVTTTGMTPADYNLTGATIIAPVTSTTFTLTGGTTPSGNSTVSGSVNLGVTGTFNASSVGTTYTYTTPVAHGLSGGDLVTITGFTGVTAYNIPTPTAIALVNSTQFSLTGVTNNPASATGVTGVSVVRVSPLSPATASGGTAGTLTFNVPVGHGVSVGEAITSAGFTPASYNVTNGQVSTVTATSVSFPYSSLARNPGDATVVGIVGVAVPNLNNTLGVNIGAASNGSSFLNSDIGEVLMYMGPMDSTSRQQIEGYLGAKWGVSMTAGTWATIPPYLTPFKDPNACVPGNKCIAWFDAADASTLLDGSNNPITNRTTSIVTWKNKGTSGGTVRDITIWNVAATRNLSYTPTAVSFPFGNGGTSSGTYTLSTPSSFTLFAVVRLDYISSSSVFVSFGFDSGAVNTVILVDLRLAINGAAPNTFYIDGVGSAQGKYGLTSYLSFTPSPADITGDNGYVVICVQRSGVNGQPLNTVNGNVGQVSSLSYDTGISTIRVNIGGGQNGRANWGEFVLYDGAITNFQRQSIEGYLMWKWGASRSTTNLTGSATAFGPATSLLSHAPTHPHYLSPPPMIANVSASA